MDDFQNELKKLKVDKFQGGDVSPWENESQQDAMLVQRRCGRCHRCSCSCSCSCVCLFINCFRCSRCSRCF
ncbi:MAG TPA: hypothetical protein DCR67_05010 [Brevibacillus sp.]|nr:hypothetical protein [Brevibacillus sp.]